MPTYRCNAPDPGSVVMGQMVPFGQEFTVPDSEPPRSMWIPIDKAAQEAFVKWNRDHVPRIVESIIKKKRLVGAKAAEFRENETARLQREPNDPIAVEERLPDEEIARTQEHLKGLFAKREEMIARRLPDGAIQVDAPPAPTAKDPSGKRVRTADQ